MRLRPHLDYSDHLDYYDKIFNESCHKKLESTQYNAALAKSGAIQVTNIVQLSQKLVSSPSKTNVS